MVVCPSFEPAVVAGDDGEGEGDGDGAGVFPKSSTSCELSGHKVNPGPVEVLQGRHAERPSEGP